MIHIAEYEGKYHLLYWLGQETHPKTLKLTFPNLLSINSFLDDCVGLYENFHELKLVEAPRHIYAFITDRNRAFEKDASGKPFSVDVCDLSQVMSTKEVQNMVEHIKKRGALVMSNGFELYNIDDYDKYSDLPDSEFYHPQRQYSNRKYDRSRLSVDEIESPQSEKSTKDRQTEIDTTDEVMETRLEDIPKEMLPVDNKKQILKDTIMSLAMYVRKTPIPVQDESFVYQQVQAIQALWNPYILFLSNEVIKEWEYCAQMMTAAKEINEAVEIGLQDAKNVIKKPIEDTAPLPPFQGLDHKK